MGLIRRHVAGSACSVLLLLALLPLTSLGADRKVTRAVAPAGHDRAHAPQRAVAPLASARGKAHSPTSARAHSFPHRGNATRTGRPGAGARAKAPAGAGVPFIPQPVSPASGGCSRRFMGSTLAFQKCVTLDKQGNFRLAWIYNKEASGAQSAQVLFEGVPEAPYGWAGWGISPTGAMTQSDALVGYGDAGNGSFAQARFYHLGGTRANLVYPDMSTGLLSLARRGIAVEVVDGGNTVRTMAVIALPPSASAQVIWKAGAAADPVTGTLVPHTDPSPANQLIDFSDTGASILQPTTAYVSNLSQKQAHAFLAGIGFGVLLPFGILFSRHGKLLTSTAWFYSHIAVQLGGYLLGVAGWAIGVWLSQQYGDMGAAPRNQFAHYCIGITVFCTATLQILTPVVKPAKEHAKRLYWNITHWSLGYITTILGIVNVFLGLEILSNESVATGVWQILYIVFISCWGAAFLILEVVSFFIFRQQQKQARYLGPKIIMGEDIAQEADVDPNEEQRPSEGGV